MERESRLSNLAGFAKLALAPGETGTASVTIDPRVLADNRAGEWVLAGGKYSFATGRSADDLGPVATVTLPARRWR